MKLQFKRISKLAKAPVYSSEGAACFDIHCTNGGKIMPGEAMEFSTGLVVEVPQGYGLFLFSRSGHGFKSSTRLANCVGVIDSDYRGEIKVKLHNDSSKYFLQVNAGERIVQGVLLHTEQIDLVEVTDVSETQRGEGGFGSTGV